MLKASPHRSRRLRKKLRVGEFQQLGFDLAFDYQRQLTDDEQWLFWDAFISEAIEANNLMFGGGAAGGYIAACGRASATERHRELVRLWLEQRPEIYNVVVGALEDAWHEPLQ